MGTLENRQRCTPLMISQGSDDPFQRSFVTPMRSAISFLAIFRCRIRAESPRRRAFPKMSSARAVSPKDVRRSFAPAALHIRITEVSEDIVWARLPVTCRAEIASKWPIYMPPFVGPLPLYQNGPAGDRPSLGSETLRCCSTGAECKRTLRCCWTGALAS